MSIAALITWIVTAGFGFFMLIRWATRGGVKKVDGAGTHLPPVRVFTHFGLAAAGLIIWISISSPTARYGPGLRSLTSSSLPPSASWMVRQWTKDGRAAMAAAAAPAAGGADAGTVEARRVDAGTVDLAEQHIPRPPVVLHGIFAVSTLILVLLTALGLGPGS